MKGERVRLRVRGVAMDGRDSTPVIILAEEGGERSLAVVSGPFEASAVIIKLEGISTPRPLTHDLLASFIADHGFVLDCVEFYGAAGDSYLARMRYRKGLSRYSREIRPSDAIALAIRLDAPLWADPALFGLLPANRFITPAEGLDSAELYYLEPDWIPRQTI
jgi:uncharacterized protein